MKYKQKYDFDSLLNMLLPEESKTIIKNNMRDISNLELNFDKEMEKKTTSFTKELYKMMVDSIETGKKYRDRHGENYDPDKALQSFKTAVKLANNIVSMYPENNFHQKEKSDIAEVFAICADTLRFCHPRQTEEREDLIRKSLQFNPKNEKANELLFDMKILSSMEPPSMNLK